MNLLLMLLIILLVLSLLGSFSWHQGYWGAPGPGYYSYSPILLIVVIFVILYATGYLR